MKPFQLITAFLFITISQSISANTVDHLIDEYKSQGANSFSLQNAKSMWSNEYRSNKDGSLRSCTTCHTNNLTKAGKHKKTGKRIDPLAPSINQDRLTDKKKIEKWFKRNCKWTLGRQCTPQEKGSFLLYIQNQ